MQQKIQIGEYLVSFFDMEGIANFDVFHSTFINRDTSIGIKSCGIFKEVITFLVNLKIRSVSNVLLGL